MAKKKPSKKKAKKPKRRIPKKRAAPKKKKKSAKKKSAVKKKPARKKKGIPKRNRPAARPEIEGTLLGRVEDFFAHINVIALTLAAPLKLGDSIRIKGHTTDLTEHVGSLQIDRTAVDAAVKGDSVGIKISERARHGDWVFLMPEDERRIFF